MRSLSLVLAVMVVGLAVAGCPAKRDEVPQMGPEEIQPAPSPGAVRPAVTVETPAADKFGTLAQPTGSEKLGPAGTQVYTVKKGDTLSSIARTFYGDAKLVKKIVDANKAKIKDPNVLPVGTVLTIPPK